MFGGDLADKSAAEWAGKHGLAVESPAHFHARWIGLAMPGAAAATAQGRLPGIDRDGSVAWLEFSSEVDVEHNYTAVVLPVPNPGRPARALGRRRRCRRPGVQRGARARGPGRRRGSRLRAFDQRRRHLRLPAHRGNHPRRADRATGPRHGEDRRPARGRTDRLGVPAGGYRLLLPGLIAGTLRSMRLKSTRPIARWIP